MSEQRHTTPRSTVKQPKQHVVSLRYTICMTQSVEEASTPSISIASLSARSAIWRRHVYTLNFRTLSLLVHDSLRREGNARRSAVMVCSDLRCCCKSKLRATRQAEFRDWPRDGASCELTSFSPNLSSSSCEKQAIAALLDTIGRGRSR